MSVGLMLITHENLGKTLLKISTNILGQQPLDVEYLSVGYDCDVQAVQSNAKLLRNKLNTGAGVLVMTDIYGSTPCNIAAQLDTAEDTKVVAGLNLPMLVRVMNYPELALPELADKAVSGGHNGIFLSAEAVLDQKKK